MENADLGISISRVFPDDATYTYATNYLRDRAVNTAKLKSIALEYFCTHHYANF